MLTALPFRSEGDMPKLVCWLLVLVITAPVVAAEEFFVGVATKDITPPIGYRMCGYFSERPSTGVHDPLLVKALYFRQGETQAVLVFCDLIGAVRSVTD